MHKGGRMRKNAHMERSRTSRAFALLLAAALSLLTACATQRHARDLLTVAQYDYAGLIRWNRFDAAAGFIDPLVLAKKPLSALEMQRYEQIQITGYYVKGNELLSPTDAAQLVEIRFVNRHTQAERSIMDQQLWRYDADAKRWWLSSGLPQITGTR